MSSRAALAKVRDQLQAELPDLAERTSELVLGRLTSYAQVEAGDIHISVQRNLAMSLRSLDVGRGPTPDQMYGAEQTCRERFVAGVTIEHLILAFRSSIGLIHQRFVELAMAEHVPTEAILNSSTILWEVGDAFTVRAAQAYEELQVRRALADAQQRAALVRALLAGETPDELPPHLLAPHTRYAAVRGVVRRGGSLDRLAAQLRRTGGSPEAPALVIIDHDQCLGLVSRRPDVGDDATVGLGELVPVTAVRHSDATARAALGLAVDLDRSGVHGVAELGWRLAAAARPDIGEMYARRYLAPVLDRGSSGQEIIATVRAWLEHGRSISRCGEVLNVHENTVRYRLRRFVELTGAELDDLDHLMGVIWVVELGHLTDAGSGDGEPDTGNGAGTVPDGVSRSSPG